MTHQGLDGRSEHGWKARSMLDSRFGSGPSSFSSRFGFDISSISWWATLSWTSWVQQLARLVVLVLLAACGWRRRRRSSDVRLLLRGLRPSVSLLVGVVVFGVGLAMSLFPARHRRRGRLLTDQLGGRSGDDGDEAGCVVVVTSGRLGSSAYRGVILLQLGLLALGAAVVVADRELAIVVSVLGVSFLIFMARRPSPRNASFLLSSTASSSSVASSSLLLSSR